ncbi:threonine--tRNA ligase [Ferroacidibacillus organovorans]|uniref:Threonine--tRNA ligase n=1 Tax=Ferroacidibacillus organovorans TaxID=1765683 RepID=A0A161QH73_9BACL|nr:threonine--tRNA ligase [Ferroacidibacillus organovorans]KYP81570.1 threonine--tRNA ligase [Ferroacidibacillus organovorans]OAG94095.1 threonine--tRNA ligase [Ferroacidibacillus organovorans]OPG16306.1 threonine--tRNA ligase [Ferroacidibacillus organovorans]
MAQSNVAITLKDGSVRTYEAGVTVQDIARDISAGVARQTVAGKIDGKFVDLRAPIDRDASLQLVMFDDKEGLEVYRHTTAHVMAQAVARLYPETKFAIGPVIEDGFYYDFADHAFTTEQFPEIERVMQEIIKADYPIVRTVMSRGEALAYFAERNDRFKVELIEDLPESETITMFTQGEFTDLCRGPHLPSTGKIKSFKLLSIAGAYWRGDAKREQLTRIYATSFRKASELEAHLALLEEMKERDHRKIGKELKLFTLAKEVGQGLPLWLPNGATVRRTIERYIVDLEERLGYSHVYTPVLGSVELYKISGHWDHYHEDMFPPMAMDNEELVLRPMNCPHHMMVYKSDMHSYRDLPLRIGELGTMHRYEMSGTLAGLQRVRAMTLNDAHIFCTLDQVKGEFQRVVRLIQQVYKDFAITDFSYRLSLRDPANTEKYVASDAMWERAEGMLREVLTEMGLPFEEAIGEAAFYGPKLDVQVKTALGKEETLSTAQLDFHLPERFELEYIGEDGRAHRPVVIHRGIVSTMERMVAYLIENYKGAFPLWLAPLQVRILPVTTGQEAYAAEVEEMLRARGVRVEVDRRQEKIGYKIRAAQLDKIPYMLVVGQKEQDANAVSVRHRVDGDQGAVAADEFAERVVTEIARRS